MYHIEINDEIKDKARVYYNSIKEAVINKINVFLDLSKINIQSAQDNKDQKYVLYAGENTQERFFFENLKDEVKLKSLITATPDEMLYFLKKIKSSINTDISFSEAIDYKDTSVTKKYLSLDEVNKLKKGKSLQQKVNSWTKKKPNNTEKAILNDAKVILANKGIADFHTMLIDVFVKTYESTYFDKSKFVRNKGFRVCPYCGRNYIYSVSIENNQADIKPDIDHFIPKVQFPFFALSYFNLVPACLTCNRTCKGEKVPLQENHDKYSIDHPYQVDPNKLESPFFKIGLNGIDLLNDNLLETPDIKIDFVSTNIDEYDRLFAIKKLYEEHNDIAHELLIRKQFWTSQTQIENYQELLADNFKERFILSVLGIYLNENKHHLRPFSKLLYDISTEYDSIVKN